VLPELIEDERMEMEGPRTAAQEIHAPPPERPGARPCQKEVHAPGLDQPMDFVQQLREPLDLADRHEARRGRQLLREPPGLRARER
jgi:hypothetical protein